MRAPSTYAEWVTVVDAFENKLDDDEVIPAMQAGTLTWQDGVSGRFSQRLVDAINTRLDQAVATFVRNQEHAYGDERMIHHSLRSLRNELAVISSALDIPALPEQYRKQYMQLVKEQADAIQQSLEESARQNDRSGRLLFMIKNTPVNKF